MKPSTQTKLQVCQIGGSRPSEKKIIKIKVGDAGGDRRGAVVNGQFSVTIVTFRG